MLVSVISWYFIFAIDCLSVSWFTLITIFAGWFRRWFRRQSLLALFGFRFSV